MIPTPFRADEDGFGRPVIKDANGRELAWCVNAKVRDDLVERLNEPRDRPQLSGEPNAYK